MDEKARRLLMQLRVELVRTIDELDRYIGAEDKPPLTPEEWKAQMENNLHEYDVTMLLDGSVKCNGCGIEYVNLADRLLRESGVKGCDGCQQKAKWG